MPKTMFCSGILLSLLFFSCGKKKDTIGIITEYYKKGDFNGAVLIAKNDTIICDTILGYSDFRAKKTFKKETPFYIASLSKPITAIGIMLLEQKKLLTYNEKASRYLSDLPGYAQNITIRQLLTHTSGIKDYEAPLSGSRGLTNQDILKWLYKQDGLKFASGSQFEYSNSGYIILSLIIEHISGKSYGTFFKDNVFVPLSMKHTTVYDETTPLIPDKAIGFTKEKQLDDYSLCTTGDGGIYATVEDLYKLDRALKNNLLLNRNNVKLMYQPPGLSNGKDSEYGMGWFIEHSGENYIAQHTGGLNGFRSLIWRDLKNDETIIALTNQGDAFPLHNFLNDIKGSLE